MTPRLPFLLCLLLAAGTAAADPLVNTKLLKRTQERIATLYHSHDQRPVAPEERSNPFRAGGDVAMPLQSTLPGENPAADASARDALLLRLASATIKVTGVVNIAGRMHIAVNQSTYREGAVIPVPLPHETVFLRVGAITSKSVTLRLEEAEVTLKF